MARIRARRAADIDALSQKITHLEQQAIDLRPQVAEREDDLAAARSANRELMAQLNATTRRRDTPAGANASSGAASAQDVVAGCVTGGRVLAAAHAWWPDEVAGAGL
jgi:chromosome segregation ATPase